MNIEEMVNDIHGRLDLAKFVLELKKDCLLNGSQWENKDIPSFLEAMAAWIENIDDYYKNTNQFFNEEASWKVFGQILMAAKVYE